MAKNPLISLAEIRYNFLWYFKLLEINYTIDYGLFGVRFLFLT